MKKFLLIILCYTCSRAVSFGQCLINGITTNPAAPVNTQLPAKKNLYFNWTQPAFQNNSSCQTLTSVESPFYKIDNLEILRASKDMLPEDGWELIRRDLGYTDGNLVKPEAPEHTYFVLYNKFTGVLRVLLKTCRGADYNGAKITIRFDATTAFQSALLDLTSTSRFLDQAHVKNPSAQSFSKFVNDKTKWFYADFPMAYDPCTCKYKSKINIISELIQNSQIQLQGSITGTITTIANGQGSVSNDGSYSFKDFTNDADKFKKGYSSVDAFITETKNTLLTFNPPNAQSILTLNTLQGALKNTQFLKTGLAAVPWLKTAVGILDFFSGGGKTSPQTVQLMPMAVNLSLKVNGTMTTSNQYHNIIFSNPGTLDAKNDPDIYSFYNEVLGVFNFINGPILLRKLGMGSNGGNPPYSQMWSYKMKQPLKWVLNPASKLQVQDAQIAYVVQSLDNTTPIPTKLTVQGISNSATSSQGFDFFEGIDASTGRREYRTEYVNFSCLGNEHMFGFTRLNVPVPNLPAVGDFFIKMIINLKRVDNPNAQNVLLVLKFPFQYENTTGTINGSLFNPLTCNGGMISEASSTEINNFCISSTYTNNRAMRLVNTTNGNFDSDIILKLSPNPARNNLTISGQADSDKIVQVDLINILGIVEKRYFEDLSGVFSKTYDLSAVKSGLYIVKTTYLSGRTKTLKFVLSK